MTEYTTDVYTGATQRLYDPAPLAIYERHAALPTWTMFALLIVVLLVVLSRLPHEAPVPVAPAYGTNIEVFSHNCVGWCP